MKYILIIAFFICSNNLLAQQFSIHNISLPKEVAYFDNQFSGLYIHADKLFFMSESRLQDKAEAKLYSISLSDINKQLKDSSYTLPYQKIIIKDIDILRNKIDADGKAYEGLEAIVIDGKDVYLSVETATPVNNCYVLKGTLKDTVVLMDTSFLVMLPKPVNTDGTNIYNAGFEAMHIKNNNIVMFYEFNNFPLESYATNINLKTKTLSYSSISNCPFRITDVTQTSKNKYTALNFFYKGNGDDAVYRISQTDKVNYKLMFDSTGNYESYARLITLTYKNNRYTWQPLFTIPGKYAAYNWEGIAAYKKGYFIMNDKYTDARPYSSTLLYLQPE